MEKYTFLFYYANYIMKSVPQDDAASHIDQESLARIYALSLTARRSYSYTKLLQKLQLKFSHTQSKDAADFCVSHNIINDKDLSKNTALVQIQKKPHSKSQLIKRLYSYGFNSEQATDACTFVEIWYKKSTHVQLVPGDKDKLSNIFEGKIGGIYLGSYVTLSPVSIWHALTLSAIILINSTNPCDETTMVRRLLMRGYVHTHICAALKTITL